MLLMIPRSAKSSKWPMISSFNAFLSNRTSLIKRSLVMPSSSGFLYYTRFLQRKKFERMKLFRLIQPPCRYFVIKFLRCSTVFVLGDEIKSIWDVDALDVLGSDLWLLGVIWFLILILVLFLFLEKSEGSSFACFFCNGLDGKTWDCYLKGTSSDPIRNELLSHCFAYS